MQWDHDTAAKEIVYMLGLRSAAKFTPRRARKLGNDKLDGVNLSTLSVQPIAMPWPFESMRQVLPGMRRGRAPTLGLTFAFAIAKMAL